METGMPVKEIMTSDPITIDKAIKISDAAKKMVEFDVGSLIVMDGHNPIGILTERDMVKKIISKNVNPDSLSLIKAMTTPLITLDADEDLQKAIDLMLKMHIRRVPIVKDKILVGLVTDTDLVSVSVEMGNIFSELVNMHRERGISTGSEIPEIITRGVCENCGKYSDNLDYLNGSLMCEYCREIDK